MKTKYVKIPVSERLPEKSGFYITFVKGNPIPATRYLAKLGFEHNNIEFWLEEKEDHSEEMLSLLEELVSLKHLKDTDGKTPYYLERQPKAWEKAKQLINKVKDNASGDK